jgi:dolichyl-phosphate-mannose--protein O-mannosyl transferase
MIYLIAKKLFNDEVLALMAAGVYSLDGLTLVLARIGMNDAYFIFFALLSLYMLLRGKNFSSAFALGFAAASKWSVFWMVPILGMTFISQRMKIKPSLLWFLVLPPLIYFASYIPMFQFSNHNIQTFIDVQKQMWWYHTNLKATHAYSSMWWSWPFLIRPVWLYTSGAINGAIANIYAMGNPIVFWFGAVACAMSAYLAYAQRDKRIGMVVFAYLAFFASWAVSPRIMFMYHYLPSIPFLAIASGYILRKYPKMIPVYFSIALITFIYFYPHFTGMKIPLWLDRSYYWFDSWR